MDDAKKLIHWAINLPPDFDPQITLFDWPKRFALNQFDYHFKFKFNNSEYQGRGIAVETEKALTKAIVEAIERTVIDKHSLKNSNGIAAHFEEPLARENAVCELIERDIFLCNFLCPLAGVVEINSNTISSSFTEILDKLKKNNIAIQLYELGTTLDRIVVLAICNGFDSKTPFGCVIGLGSHLVREVAIHAALIEMIRNVVTQIDNNICPEWQLTQSNFSHHDEINFSINEHSKIALTEEYGRWIWQYFLEKREYLIRPDNIKKDEIQVRILNLDSRFSGLGIKIYQAYSDSLQNLFFNMTSEAKVNLERLDRYMGTPTRFENLTLRMHPLA